MQCISCGKRLTKENKICPKCGKNQPLAETDKLTKRPTLKSLASICLLIGLILIPLAIIAIISLILISTYEKISIFKFLLGLTNILSMTAVPFVLALLFNKIK